MSEIYRENTSHHNHSVQVTEDSYLKDMRIAMDAVISPNGKWAAFVVFEWVPEQPKQRGRIWVVEASGKKEARPLTHGKRGDANPCWSPDSQQLAYISKGEGEKEKPQLHIIPAIGGEARQVCKIPNGVSNLEWSPDGSRIAFRSLEGEEPKTDPKVFTPDQARHQRLWTVRVDSDTPQPVTPDGLSVWQYTWSPDGRQFALFYATGPGETDWFRGQIGLVPAAGGAIRQVSHLDRPACALAWSPDSTRLAYLSGEWSDPDRAGGDIFVLDLASGETRNLTPTITSSPGWCRWLPGGDGLLYVAWAGLSHQVGIVDAIDGTLTTLADDLLIGEHRWPHLSTTPDLQHFVFTQAEHYPPDVWSGTLTFEGKMPTGLTKQRLTHLNPIHEETLSLVRSERIRYRSVDDWEIDATYTPPTNHQDNQDGMLPPLIVNIHGGPSGSWADDWDNYRSQILSAAGFAILRPNIRGSMGRGATFADAVVGDMGGKDLQDILYGIDYLIKRGLVDGTRVGIMGWSYGGFMSAWAVTQTTRFKAAIMGAGVCDFHSFHAQTNIPDWDMRFLGKAEPVSPLAHPEIYRERSAITYAARVVTPTLIIHGENDECVPVNQAYTFHRALRERNVPTELVIYPREGHGLAERDHIRDYQDRMVKWFKKYV